jgi:hypothetical protein
VYRAEIVVHDVKGTSVLVGRVNSPLNTLQVVSPSACVKAFRNATVAGLRCASLFLSWYCSLDETV